MGCSCTFHPSHHSFSTIPPISPSLTLHHHPPISPSLSLHYPPHHLPFTQSPPSLPSPPHSLSTILLIISPSLNLHHPSHLPLTHSPPSSSSSPPHSLSTILLIISPSLNLHHPSHLPLTHSPPSSSSSPSGVFLVAPRMGLRGVPSSTFSNCLLFAGLNRAAKLT